MTSLEEDDVQTIGVTHVPTSRNVTPCKRQKDHSQPDPGVTYEFSSDVNLDDVINAELLKLDIGSAVRSAIQPMDEQVAALEDDRKTIDTIFEDCLKNIQRITKCYNDEEKALDQLLRVQHSSQDTIVIEDEERVQESDPEDGEEEEEEDGRREELIIDDDEDVQIVDTTYEPKKKTIIPPSLPIIAAQKPPSGILKVNGPLDSTQLSQLPDGQLIQMVNDDGKKVKTFRVRKVPFYQTQKRAALPRPVVGMTVYAKKNSEVWNKGIITDIVKDTQGQLTYRIKFDGKGLRFVTGKQLAYFNQREKLPLGTRIIAPYREVSRVTYYSGITAEPPSTRNNYRYLVFFDDGYAQYSSISDVMQVYVQNNNVWEDVGEGSRVFIKQYLEQYPERPMVRLQKNQQVKTEWNGKWWTARVLEVDASLVKMIFDADKRTEWIYRGSTRLAPLYTELANAGAGKLLGKARRVLQAKSTSRPYVEYTRNHGDEPEVILCDDPKTDQSDSSADSGSANQSPSTTKSVSQSAPTEERRAVAKKSTGAKYKQQVSSSVTGVDSPRKEMPSVGDSHQGYRAKIKSLDCEEESLGSRIELLADKLNMNLGFVKKFAPHNKCSKACIGGFTGSKDDYRGYNPLIIPMYFGWERHIAKTRTNPCKRHLYYLTPCSRRLRTIAEVDRHLLETDSPLTIDMFCFDPTIHPFIEFRPVKTFCDIKDLSYGKENVPISCVNNCDRKYPDYVEYSNQRLPAKGVTLNTDKEFLCGCDCEDDCRDRSSCACRQLTVQMTAATKANRIDPEAGYDYRRLDGPLLTGIYECNAQCKCSDRCHNRVAQNGLSLRLQVFKTEKRGWGLRCLDDIPMGGFVCIYAGQLLTDQDANEDGHQYGDEYLAELDHIEIIQGLKEGKEEDVVDPGALSDVGSGQDSDSHFSGDSGDDSGLDTRAPSGRESEEPRRSKRFRRKSTSSGRRKSAQNLESDEDYLPDLEKNKKTESRSKAESGDSDDSDDPTNRFSRLSQMPDPTSLHGRQSPSNGRTGFMNPRVYYGEESCYIMDAKSIGNIGRYLNHSCEPNIFVQNVFVDTHDLRFPWVAFFTYENIRAGTELTWDYNYDVGSVEGKVLYCYCGASRCRLRLL